MALRCVAGCQRTSDQVSRPLIYVSFPGHSDNTPRIALALVVRLFRISPSQMGWLWGELLHGISGTGVFELGRYWVNILALTFNRRNGSSDVPDANGGIKAA